MGQIDVVYSPKTRVEYVCVPYRSVICAVLFGNHSISEDVVRSTNSAGLGQEYTPPPVPQVEPNYPAPPFLFLRPLFIEADDYAVNVDQRSNLKVLVVNRVIVGKPYRIRENATNLTEPPCGHHSVIGEPGIDLNYEETVVYTNDAIRPAYVIVYGESTVVHNKVQALIKTLFKTPVAS